jgi:hypothetical protein
MRLYSVEEIASLQVGKTLRLSAEGAQILQLIKDLAEEIIELKQKAHKSREVPHVPAR